MLSIPKDILVEIFRYSDGSSLYHLRRTCKKFCLLIDKFCYEKTKSGLLVNGKMYGLHVNVYLDCRNEFDVSPGYYQRLFRTDSYITLCYDKSIRYLEGNLEIIYQLESSIYLIDFHLLRGAFSPMSKITTLVGGNKIYQETNSSEFFVRYYFEGCSTDIYLRVKEKLFILSRDKETIRLYLSTKGLILSISRKTGQTSYGETCKITNRQREITKEALPNLLKDNLKTSYLKKFITLARF